VPEPKIFISYSHQDAGAFRALMEILSPFQSNGQLKIWADTRLEAGDNWSDEIEKGLAVSTVAVLLVSRFFLSSDFISKMELPVLLQRQAAGEVRIIPVYLSKSTADILTFRVTDPRTKAQKLVKLTSFQAGGNSTPDKPIDNSGRPNYTSMKWRSAFDTLARELISLSGDSEAVSSAALSVHELLGCASEKLKLMLASEASAHTEFFQKYVRQVYFERQGANESFDEFLKLEDPERCCFVVVGKAGKGKTNLLCHLASMLSHSSSVGIHIPVLLSSSELKLEGEKTLRTAVVERLIERPRQDGKEPTRPDLLDLAGMITAEKGVLVIFIDALNELEGTGAFRRFSEQLEELIRDCRALGHRVAFCMSCRSEIWHHFKAADWARWARQHIFGAPRSGEPTLEVDNFDERDIDVISQQYFKWYAIDATLLGSARKSCCDPLMLRYLCAAYTRRPPNDKTTPPQAIPKYMLGHVPTLRRKEAFDTFVKNRRESMFKVVQRALRHDDDRSLYSFTTLYLMTMAYRMFQERRPFLKIEEVMEIAKELDHPDWRLGGKDFFQSKPESVFFMFVDEGIILNKRDQSSVSFTFEAYFEYSLGRYFAHERWPRKLAAGVTEDGIVEDFKDLLRQHRELAEECNFHNLFGACHFAILELEQSSEEAGSGAGLIASPTLFIRLVEAMTRASGEGLDWVQQALSTIRETAIVQPETWQHHADKEPLRQRFAALIKVLDDLTRTSEWLVLWDLEETLSVLAAANCELTLERIRSWVEGNDGLQPIFGVRALRRLGVTHPQRVLDLLLELAQKDRFHEKFWLARTLIATARMLSDPDRPSPLVPSDREKLWRIIRSLAYDSCVPAIRGVALAALPYVSESRALGEISTRVKQENWPWALWNLAFELQDWKRYEDGAWVWDLLEQLAGGQHPHVLYAVECAVERLRISCPSSKAAAINERLQGNRWRKDSVGEMSPPSEQIGIVYSPAFLEGAYDDHVECRERIEVIVDQLERLVPGDCYCWINPRKASRHDLERAHSRETDQHRDRSPWRRYLEDVEQSSKAQLTSPASTGFRTGSFELRFESYDAALLSAGGVLSGVDYVLNGKALVAWSLNRPPGHLANNTICILNNVAIAALYARERYRKKRLFILDFDAHHGSHTNRVFKKDPDAIYFSIHQRGNYAAEAGSGSHTGEGVGEGLTFNVNYPPTMGDAGYAYVVEHLLVPVLREWKPDIIFLSAGFDGHFDDPLTKGRLSELTYIHLAEQIRAVALELGVKIVSTFEGGYGLRGMTSSMLHMLRIFGEWPLSAESIGFLPQSPHLAEDPTSLAEIQEVVRKRVALMAEIKRRKPAYPLDPEQPHWQAVLALEAGYGAGWDTQ
jgi:acetoin utilization deacetylase AcuC-like enzyme